VSELVPCPTCQAMLRVPPEAQMIRCPACKTVLAVSAEPVEATPPLPFGPVPAAPPPMAHPAMTMPSSPPLASAAAPPRPAAAPQKAVAEDVDHSIYDPNAKRRRRLTVATERPYEDLDDDEKKLYRKMERLTAECKPGQTGMQILSWAYRLGALGHLALAAGGLMLSLGNDVSSLVVVILGLNGLFGLMIAVGLGFCAAGPRGMRGAAGFGAAVALATVACSPIAFTIASKDYGVAANERLELYENRGDAAVVHYATMVPTHCLSIMPGLLFTEKTIPLFAIFAAVLELTRHFVVCALARFYADEGKDPDLGYRANRYLFRLAIIMTTVTVIASIGWGMELRGTFAGGQRFDYLIIIVAINLGVLTMGVSLLAQGQALSDIAEIVDAKRFADHARRLVTY
jgi:LSD1 subclass zinc finger protein